MQTRDWRPDWPCPVAAIWSPWRRGAGDPFYRVDERGRHWRGLLTPEGSSAICVAPLTPDGVVAAQAWGEGAEWALDHLPAMLGAHDDPSGFTPLHEPLKQAWRQLPHWRVGTGGVVWQAMAPAIIEQKVTGQEAFSAQRRLGHRFASLAPGPGADLGLRIPLTAEEMRRIPSWEWLRLPVDHARSSTLLRAARVASGLERTLTVDVSRGPSAGARRCGRRQFR